MAAGLANAIKSGKVFSDAHAKEKPRAIYETGGKV